MGKFLCLSLKELTGRLRPPFLTTVLLDASQESWDGGRDHKLCEHIISAWKNTDF